jgi:3-isopropylmalate dehydrogenase
MPSNIAVLAGDGVGPEVVGEARKVLETVAAHLGRHLEFTEGLIGGCSIDATGSPLPDATIELCRRSDAVLLGAVGGPKWDNPSAAVRPEQGLLRLRSALGLFANLRPVRVHRSLMSSAVLRPDLLEGVDLIVVRELTGGIYFGPRGRRKHATGEEAYDTMVYSTGEVERVVRVAGRLAQARRRKVVSIDKANVLEASRLWRSTADRVLKAEFADVQAEHLLVDAAAMHLLRCPSRFDVMVTGNMFGDILTDEASMLAGSMGMLPSASLGADGPGLFEPIHGSAPDIAGRGVANPVGMILSAAMMCRESLAWPEAADCIEQVVDRVICGGARTADIAQQGDEAISTTEMGDRIASAVREIEPSAALA